LNKHRIENAEDSMSAPAFNRVNMAYLISLNERENALLGLVCKGRSKKTLAPERNYLKHIEAL